MNAKESEARSYSHLARFHQGRSQLLFIIAGAVVALTIPFVIQHIDQPSMIYHILLHIAGTIIAVFLCAISIFSYREMRSPRQLFAALGFVALGLVEVVSLLNATDNVGALRIPVINMELGHLILVITLGFFGAGVLQGGRR